MNQFFNYLFSQKKLALVFSISIIAMGLLVLSDIQRNQFPLVDLEIVIVSTAYPGASPEEVEQNVTNPIEDELKGVSGIEEYTSTSKEGISTIVITLAADVDVVSTKQEIREAVNRVRDFPDEVTSLPRVIDAQPSKGILSVGINAPMSYSDLREVVDEATKVIERIKGISEVEKDGYLDKEIQIRLNIDKLEQYKLSLNQVISAISTRNKRYTVGTNHSDTAQKNIVVLASFDKDINFNLENVVLKSNFNGPIIRLKDVASIRQSNVEQKKIVRINGKKGFILTIFKQDHADVIDSVAEIKQQLNLFNQQYNGVLNFSYSSDESLRVNNRLEIVTTNGLIGLVMVLIVLTIFLNFKTAFWVALSLPVSLLGTVLLLGMNGENINMISLAAMILVLGIVVDDSIVVAESIHHYKQKGLNAIDAATQGFKRVIMPIITTITTTILVFSSMFLMGGMMGKFIYVIPLVVIFALTLSLLEVSIALPAHLAGSSKNIQQNSWFDSTEKVFSKIILQILQQRYWVVGGFIVVLVLTLIFAKNNVKFVLFPAVGSNHINVRMEMPKGSSLELTQKTSQQVERLITEVIADDMSSVTNNVSQIQARFRIDLINASERKRGVKTLVKLLKERKNEVKNIKKLSFSVARPGPPQGEDIQISLVGNDRHQRTLATNRLEQIMVDINGLGDIKRDDELGKNRLEVVLDFAKMARLGIDFSLVNRYLRTAFTGVDITNIRQGESQVDFRVYFGEGDNSEAFLNQLKISNNKGNLVPISAFSSVREIQGEPDFNHVNGRRATRISAAVDDDKVNLKKASERIFKALDIKNTYPKVKVEMEGGAQDTMDSMKDFVKAFVFSIFGIYFLLLLLFNSYTQPLLVLSAVPFSVVGVIWAFFFHSEPLSFFAALGTLALVGVIVNDSLILVNHLNFLSKDSNNQHIDVKKWIAHGTTARLRAVVLTTLTTLAGIIPLAYGIGGVDFLLQPMALALGYGLLFGTLMTLILLPCLYLMNYEFVNWVQRSKKIFTKS